MVQLRYIHVFYQRSPFLAVLADCHPDTVSLILYLGEEAFAQLIREGKAVFRVSVDSEVLSVGHDSSVCLFAVI